ncbi:hypothetical protein F2Q70_00032595 [Brassica cretica]|uniref:Uncharacterized protein n=1 Tax=Brassica cretica TaxID=69181 RepID=A0A8S9FIT3_BRACR|nr:hypothetical protein F2Q70_00032595 [Brassica cretica]KAF2553182.1 hypothetical protein F2Q68_00036955 [Brassica cretica]
MKLARAASPALALVECMFKNRFFVPFDLWGGLVIDICRENGTLASFLKVFKESCRLSTDEKLDYMKPDFPACNAAIEACCRQMESLSDAESVIESMSVIGFLGYLYARKGLKEKINELESLMDGKFKEGKTKLDHALADAFLNALVKGGFFGTAMQVVEKCREMKVLWISAVRTLDLTHNKISDVPVQISKLINMQRLLIADNLIERLPGNLGKLQSLKVLILDGNRISCLPDELGQLIRLEQLSISRNMLIYLPDTIGSLRNLVLLNVSNNRLKSLPESLGSCASLEEIQANGMFLVFIFRTLCFH